jgi:hypothetical protein
MVLHFYAYDCISGVKEMIIKSLILIALCIIGYFYGKWAREEAEKNRKEDKENERWTSTSN